MAINRTFNAIWAEISAWGSLIKTATTHYVPTPGGQTVQDSGGNSIPNGANNQAAYALASGSPFTEVNRDGISADLAYTAGPGDAANASLTPLDEASGKYHVVRQYGDIYMYNDGNIVSWGGNGKNFSFGNGYEENHAWANQPAVYNNEVFQIPRGAMSLYLPQPAPSVNIPLPGPWGAVTLPLQQLLPQASLLPLPANGSLPSPVEDYEWLGGAVSKNWGNEYNYNFGASYEWTAGPSNYMDAYGNVGDALKDVKQGKHCTYSYGTGYEEALISWDQGSKWFHADDSTSPYASRKHDDWNSGYLAIESVATSFAQGAADQAVSGVLGAMGVTGDSNEEAMDSMSEGQAALDAVFNPTDFAKRNTWQAANLLVSKAFGNTYEYHYGPGLSVQEGPTEERNYGNSSSTVVGNKTESVTGNSITTTTGNKTETTTGNSTEMVQGDSVEQFWGGKAEFFMGGKSEMSLGAADEINLAAKVEIVAGVALEIFLGFKTEIGSAGSLDLELGPDLKLTPTDAQLEEATAKIAVLEAGQATLANFAMTAADVICNI